jgi:hypothetical protein
MMSLELRALCDQLYGDGTDSMSILLSRSIEIAVSDANFDRRKMFRKLAFKTLEKQASKDFGPASLEHRAVTLMEQEWKGGATS